MRQIKEVLRQKWVLGRTHRQVAESVGVSAGVVGKLMQKTAAAKLDWAQVEGLTEQERHTQEAGHDRSDGQILQVQDHSLR